MKVLLIALALIVGGSKAMAAKDCTPYLVSPAGSEGEFHYVYPCGADHTVTHRGCKEGEVGYFPTYMPNGDINPNGETRVCHNGTFFPGYTGDVPHRGCNEGEVAYDSVLDPSGNFYQQVKVVCHNGTFGPARRR
ncbi:MAG: hypothetical protein ACXVB9_15520 [Bdellovibrionota bacterium]